MNQSTRPLPCPPSHESRGANDHPLLIGDDFDETPVLQDQPMPGERVAPSVAQALLSLRFVLPRAA